MLPSVVDFEGGRQAGICDGAVVLRAEDVVLKHVVGTELIAAVRVDLRDVEDAALGRAENTELRDVVELQEVTD